MSNKSQQPQSKQTVPVVEQAPEQTAPSAKPTTSPEPRTTSPAPVELDHAAIAAQEVIVADLTAKLEAAKKTGNDHAIAEAKKIRKGATDKLWRLQNPGGKGGTRSPNSPKAASDPNSLHIKLPEATISALDAAVAKFAPVGLDRSAALNMVIESATESILKFNSIESFASGLKAMLDAKIAQMVALQSDLLASK